MRVAFTPGESAGGARRPRLALPGVDAPLSLCVYDDTDTLLVPNGVTLAVYLYGALLAAPAVTVDPSGHLTATLPGTVTAGKLGAGLLELWTVTVDGQAYPLPVSGMLVRTLASMTLNDGDIDGLHNGLAAQMGIDSFLTFRLKAWDLLQAWLEKGARRPQAILNQSVLVEAHLYWTMVLISRHGMATTSDPFYTRLLDEYKEELKGELALLPTLIYDADGDGLNNDEPVAGAPTAWGGVPPADFYYGR